MSGNTRAGTLPKTGSSLARTFSRLGWTGFWLQVVFGSLPILLMAYYFAFSRTAAGPRGGFPLIEYLTIANLALLAFTTLWSFRYTRLAGKIADSGKRPAQESVVKTVWTGVTVGSLSILFSMVIMLFEAASLLFYFLKAPQGGMPVFQSTGAEAIHWISSVDMISLMALILMLFAEVIVLMFSLWLLFRSSAASPEYPESVTL